MPSHPTPTNILEMRGSFIDNPQRKKARQHEPKKIGELGAAPSYFTKQQRAMWNEIKKHTYKGVLGEGDRFVVEMISVLFAEFRADTSSFSGAKYGRLETMLARLGLTPSDRTKIIVSDKEDKKDPWSDL